MTDDNSLYSDPKPADEFRTESPLRAFAEYQEFGGWLIAKGFRPSLQHLVRYLAAMESREGYRLVQILEAASGVPTMIFRTTARAPLDEISHIFKATELERGNACVEYRIDPEKEKRAQELFDRNFGKSTANVPNTTITIPGLDPEKVIWNRVQWRGEIEKLFVVARERPHHVRVKDFLKREKVTDMGRYYRTASVGSVLRLIDMLEGWDHYGLDEAITDDALYNAIGKRSLAARAGCKDVTSQTAVDVLESMAEDIADELGIEVDRDSFQVAREHCEAMVPVDTSYDIPDDQKVEAIHYVVDRVVNPKWRSKALRDFKKSFMNPKGTPLPPHDKFDAQLAFTLSTDIGNVRNHLAAFKRTKQGDKAINEMVERNAPAIRELLGAKYKSDRQHDFGDVACRICGDTGKIMSIGISDICPGEDCLARSVDVTKIEGLGPVDEAERAAEDALDRKFDDANPEHYNGWECGDIGERLTANGYQILKYCWRLGKKDDPCKELTKALRYLDREVDYMNVAFPGHTLVPNFGGIAPSNRLNYLFDRTANQSQFTADVARFLWNGYTAEMLDELKALIVDHRFHLDCGNGLAI